MGAARTKVQTADKNNNSQLRNVKCEVKSCMLVINKSILKTFFCSNHCFQVKYESSVYNTGSSSAQVVFYLNHERTNQAQFTTTNSSKEMCRRVLMCEDNRGWTFSLEEALLSKRKQDFGQKKWFKGIVHPKIEMTP